MKLHIIGSDNYCHSVDVFNWDFPIHVGDEVRIMADGVKYYLRIDGIEHRVDYRNGFSHDDVNVTAKIAVNAHRTKEEVDQLASIIGMRQ